MDGEIDTSLEWFLSYYLESTFQFLLEISLEITFASGSTLQVFNLHNGSVWLILDRMILCPDRRNKKIVFTTKNVFRIGLNNPSYRLRSVFKYDWKRLARTWEGIF